MGTNQIINLYKIKSMIAKVSFVASMLVASIAAL